ncbi:MAG: hypothetical protein EBT15_11250 [Betaproteobacteria bacterium]|nr:hypothetical protein [Betaproteobacteria bacterium]
MNRTTKEFTVDDHHVGTMTVTYEFNISRKRDCDDQGRRWYIPHYTHGILSVEFSAPGSSRSMKWDFKSGKEMDGRIKKAMQALDYKVWNAIEEYVTSLVNDPNYEGEPGEPADASC